MLGDQASFSAELFGDHFRNDEAQAYPLSIHFLVAFDPAEELEKLALLRLPDSDAVVEDCQHDFVVVPIGGEEVVEFGLPLHFLLARQSLVDPVLEDVATVKVTRFLLELEQS